MNNVMNASVPRGTVFAIDTYATGTSIAASRLLGADVENSAIGAEAGGHQVVDQFVRLANASGRAIVADLHAQKAAGLEALFDSHCSDGSLARASRLPKTYLLGQMNLKLSDLAARIGDGPAGERLSVALRGFGVNEVHHIKRAIHGVVISALVKDLVHHHPYPARLMKHLTAKTEDWISRAYDVVTENVASGAIKREIREINNFVRHDGLIEKITDGYPMFQLARAARVVLHSPPAKELAAQLSRSSWSKDIIDEIESVMYLATVRYVYERHVRLNDGEDRISMRELHVATKKVKGKFGKLLKRGIYHLFRQYGLSATRLTFSRWLAQVPAESFFSHQKPL